MIHLTEDLMDAISKLETLDIPDDGYVSTPYKHGKVLLMRQGTYWGISIDDKEESVSLNFYGEHKKALISKAISYIETWTGAGL